MNIFLLINIYFLLSKSLCELDMRGSPRLRRLNDLKISIKVLTIVLFILIRSKCVILILIINP